MTTDDRPDPWMLPWRGLTWKERGEMVVAWIVATMFGVALFIGIVILVGSAVDNISARKAEIRSCLQQATNGLEIEECKR